MTKVYYSFVYKNPNKILKTFKAKISGRAMITVASSYRQLAGLFCPYLQGQVS
jgi:hypothetical protein